MMKAEMSRAETTPNQNRNVFSWSALENGDSLKFCDFSLSDFFTGGIACAPAFAYDAVSMVEPADVPVEVLPSLESDYVASLLPFSYYCLARPSRALLNWFSRSVMYAGIERLEHLEYMLQ